MRFLVIKRTVIWSVLFVMVLCGILAIPLGENAMSAVFFGDNLRKIPVYNVDTTEKRVAISFDAAWGADKTRDIMKILSEYNANSTFFLVGFWAEKYADIVKEIHDNGFEIGTHSNTHPDMTKLSREQVSLELEQSIAKIKNAVDIDINLFRPPFGAYNNQLLEVAESMNLQTIQWNVDSLDWKGISGSEIANRILTRVNNGSIILCHNNSDHILDALPIVLDRLKLKGYTVGCVGDLVYKENYTIDRAGVQHLNN